MKQKKKLFSIILCLLVFGTVSFPAYAENESSLDEETSVSDESSTAESSTEMSYSDESSYTDESSYEYSYAESSTEEYSYSDESSAESWTESSVETTEPSYTESSADESSYTESTTESSTEDSSQTSEESSGLAVFESDPLEWLKSMDTIIPADNADYTPPAERSMTASFSPQNNLTSAPPTISDTIINKPTDNQNNSSFVLGIIIWLIIGLIFISTAVVIWHSKTPKFNPTRTYFKRKKKKYNPKSYSRSPIKKRHSMRNKKHPATKSYRKYKIKK